MPSTEREERLRRAERARQAGRFDVAIAELEGLVAMFPDDVLLANTLGDLHVSQGEPGPALPLFLRVGDHYFHEGFYSKATGVYRKILKFVPRDESMVLRLAEALAAQGLTVEARAQFTAVETARRSRGDVRGAEDVALRLADLEPADLAARWSAARALAQRGDAAAVGRYEELADAFERQQRFDDALAVWHEVISLTPSDVVRRERAARRAWARGDAMSARIFLGIDDLPPHGPSLALWTEIELRAGSADGVRAAASRWLDFDPGAQASIVELAHRVAPHGPWIALFDQWLGGSAAQVRPPMASVEPVRPVAPAVAAPQPVDVTPLPVAPPVAASPAPSRHDARDAGGDAERPAREFVEIDLTAALNAIAAHTVQAGEQPTSAGTSPPGPSSDASDAHRDDHVSEVDARAGLAQGQAFLAAGMLDEAREVLTRALGSGDTAVEAALALGDLHGELGHHAEACRLLEHVLPSAVGRERGQVLAQLVVHLERVGDAAQSLRRLAELADVLPQHPIVRARRGREEPPGR